MKYEELVSLLEELGYRKGEARVLAALCELNGKAPLREIERVARIGYSVTYAILKSLEDRGLVSFESVEREGPGRPPLACKLTVPMERVILESVRKSRERLEADIQKLKELELLFS